jgi:hypothetical protein
MSEAVRLEECSARAARAWGIAALCSLLPGCTVLSDFDVDVCESDLECYRPGAEPRHCDSARCVPGCRDNRHCASIDPGAPICQFPGGECTALTSGQGECYVSSAYSDASMGALTARDMLVMGAFAPRVRSSAWLTLELAAREINEAGGLGSMPLLLGVCSDAREEQPGAMEYLVHQLRVTTLVASLGEEALDAAASLVDDTEPVLLSPFGYDTSLTNVTTETPEIWYLGSPYRSVVAGYRPLVQALAASAQTPPGEFKIALVRGTSREDMNLAALVRETLALGDAGSMQLEREDRVHPFVLLDDVGERERTIDEIVDYAPNVILWFAGGTFADPQRDERVSIIPAIEERAAGAAAIAPVYVLGPRNVDDSSLQHLARGGAQYLPRLIGLRADRPYEPSIKEALDARFRQAFPRAEEGPIRYHHPAHSTYDAVYYLAHAAVWNVLHGGERAAAGLLAVTQPDAESLVLGPEPAARARALELIVAGSPVNLRGTSGPALFDPTLRARPAVVRVYCWAPGVGLEDGAQLDATTGTFTPLPGNCPVVPFDERD